MWVMECLNVGKFGRYILLPNETYSIGRKDCHITINENAVSRKHASLVIQGSQSPGVQSTVRITDSSKFGTFLDNVKIDGSSEILGQSEIYFGHPSCKFRLSPKPLIVTSSCIRTGSAKRRLNSALAKLGGLVVNEWNDECSFLVMDKITFTIKVVCALIHCIPIVTPDYFEKLVESRKSPKDPWLSHERLHFIKGELAIEWTVYLTNDIRVMGVESFQPEIGEPLLKDKGSLFSNDEDRKKIFEGKTFFTFSNKQYKRLQSVIQAASGKIDYVETVHQKVKDIVSREGSMVLRPESRDDISLSSKDQVFKEEVTSALQRSGLRLVRESEVGLAIFFKSLESYCNPKSADGSGFDSVEYENSCLTSTDVLTQEIPVQTGAKLERVILAKESQSSPGNKRMYPSKCYKSVIDESEPLENSSHGTEIGKSDLHSECTELPIKRLKTVKESFFAPRGSSKDSSPPEEVNTTPAKDVEMCKDEFRSRLGSSVTDNICTSKPVDENKHNGSFKVGHLISNECRTKVEGTAVEVKVFSEKVDKTSLALSVHHDESVADRDIDRAGDTKFLSTQQRPKMKIKEEMEMESHQTLVKVQFVSLLVRKAGKCRQILPQVMDKKNFKKFRKTFYPGKDKGIPRIIGGDDLVAYQKEDNNGDIVFARLLEEDKRREEEERYLDRLFNFTDDPARKKRKFR